MNEGNTGPGATGTGKTVVAGRAARRAKRAAEDARDATGKILARDARTLRENFSGGVPRVFRGALRAPGHVRRRDHFPCARGPGSRIAFVNFVLPYIRN